MGAGTETARSGQGSGPVGPDDEAHGDASRCEGRAHDALAVSTHHQRLAARRYLSRSRPSVPQKRPSGEPPCDPMLKDLQETSFKEAPCDIVASWLSSPWSPR